LILGLVVDFWPGAVWIHRSSVVYEFFVRTGQDSIAVETFEQLELSDSDVNCFWKAFIDMDADDSGNIRADEFFAYFNIENTGLNSKIFMTMDSDHSGYLNFCMFSFLLLSSSHPFHLR
jgi:Ca2+-binding EF-hand superfamily protein